jgi:hypothetical protein
MEELKICSRRKVLFNEMKIRSLKVKGRIPEKISMVDGEIYIDFRPSWIKRIIRLVPSLIKR